ncbi:MAG: hypothetical protein J6Y40_00630 [Bacteroidales bacterium]|nr:hypothetical protein [Bacteroidales bacterium]
MRILTLFLALFLTLLPESADFAPFSHELDACWEEVNDVEEEAVIRPVQRSQKLLQASSFTVSGDLFGSFIRLPEFPVSQFCFERQWLRCCKLRL